MVTGTVDREAWAKKAIRVPRVGSFLPAQLQEPVKVKLYATSEQFPAILYQILQEVEAEGYTCRELYVDTFKVNFSAAAEEVAAMFKVRIVTISSGSSSTGDGRRASP
jgi:hypothetical protein